ncbi:MAG TPA: HD-GYP domain-containing protein [Streptosporangiaceae bacterium]|nr:HD-GYP domain-containing protein [Streptosporangiaceae bacterium]
MVSRAAWLYIGLVVLVTAALVDSTSFTPSAIRHFWLYLVILQLLFLVCDSTPAPLVSRQTKWSPSSSATLAAVVLLGPVAAALVGAVSLLSIKRQLKVPERVFNGAMTALSGLLAGKTYLALHGHVGLPGRADFPEIILPFAAAAAAHVIANQGLIWGVYRLNRGPGMLRREGLESSLPLLLVSDLGYAALGLIIASLWSVMYGFAAALVLVPLFVARWAMGQFAEQQRAYSATMKALCQAVETKDYYTRGHGDRVSLGSVMIARQIGMGADRTDAIEFAGMLHDVGKLGVPTTVLQKTGPLTEDEYAAIQLHPMRGLEIVREIGFLNEALAGIMHHHERIDGRGYPMGFAGHEIPEFARIIAVADAFDSMTSTRSYREAKTIPEAVSELKKGADTQFDPLIVEAFIAALDRYGWRLPEPATEPADLATITVQDHDDPTAPLRVIEVS